MRPAAAGHEVKAPVSPSDRDMEDGRCGLRGNPDTPAPDVYRPPRPRKLNRGCAAGRRFNTRSAFSELQTDEGAQLEADDQGHSRASKEFTPNDDSAKTIAFSPNWLAWKTIFRLPRASIPFPRDGREGQGAAGRADHRSRASNHGILRRQSRLKTFCPATASRRVLTPEPPSSQRLLCLAEPFSQCFVCEFDPGQPRARAA